MSLGSKAFARSMITASTVIILLALSSWTSADHSRFLTLLCFGIIASQVKFRIPGFTGTFTASLFILFICIVELSTAETVVISLAAAATQTMWRAKQRPDLLKFAFNMATLTIAATGSQGICQLLATRVPDLGTPGILALTAGSYFFLNTAPVAFIISLTEGGSSLTIWRNSYWSMFPFYLAGSAFAGILHYPAKHFGWQVTFLLIPLLYLIHRTYEVFIGRMDDSKRHLEELTALQMRSIRTMAVAVEAKDETTATHLHRVQTYAMGIGKELGLSPDEMQALQAASILHDVGKLAVPEYIISKPGKLTAEEFEKMKSHTIVGGEIVEGMEFPYPVAPIVRAHHEKWNGAGYPDGLSGSQIPIGARILGAVDCLDALATDRQYRRALPLDKAMEIVKADSGKAFDPAIIEILARRYRDLEAAAHAGLVNVKIQKLSIETMIDRGAAPDAGLEQSAGIPHEGPQQRLNQLLTISTFLSGFNSLMDGLKETPAALRLEYLCYSLSTSLQTLIPHDSLAIFGRSGDTIVTLTAHGEDADLLSTLEVPMGSGLVGWVAMNHKQIVNGNPGVEPEADRWIRHTTLRSALAVPLEDSATVGGVIGLYSCKADNFTVNQVKILKLLVPRLLQVIKDSHQYKTKQSASDVERQTECTGFLELLDASIQHATINNQPLLLVRIDLGSQHSIEHLLREFRDSGTLGRLGPNEFALLVSGVDRASMLTCLESALRNIDEAIIFGVAQLSPSTGSLEELLAEAEHAVCEARNQRVSTGLFRLGDVLATTAGMRELHPPILIPNKIL